MINDKRVFLFDLDWTILDYKFYPNIYNEIISRCKITKITPSELREKLWEKSRQLIKEGKHLESHDWDFVLNILLTELDVKCEISFTDLVVEDVMRNGEPFKPGAKETLLHLKKRGVIIGVLTNGYVKYQKIKITISGLERLVDFIIYIDDARSIKPFKRFFECAFKKAEEFGGRVVSYVGDNLFFDVIGGLNAGIDNVIWYREKKDIISGQYVLKELKLHLEKYLRLFDSIIPFEGLLNKKFYTINHLTDILALKLM